MSPPTLDLLLGSDIGLWILEQVRAEDVGVVITRDRAIQERAEALGIASSRTATPASGAAVSAHYPAILSPDDLTLWSIAYNLHPGYLPWGRGYAPVFWAIWAGEPAGAALHVMTARVDAGAVVERRRALVPPDATGESLYDLVLATRKALFRDWWPRLVHGERPSGTTPDEIGSYHSRAEFLALRDSPPADHALAELERLRRALTFRDHPLPPGLNDRIGELLARD